MTLAFYREPSGRYLAFEAGSVRDDPTWGPAGIAWVFGVGPHDLWRFTCLPPDHLAKCERVELSDIPEPWRTPLARLNGGTT